MATLDPSLDVLRSEILEQAPEIDRAEIGWIAGADHRQSGPHFPENPAPPGNPPDEVDALDAPHAPDRGLDCHVLCEQLRTTSPNRHLLRLVIFDGRQFSSYARDGYDPWEWRPYYGEDMHREHAHIERDDQDHGDTSPWGIRLREDTDMGKIMFAHDKATNTLWACDGITRRKVSDKEATDLRYLGNVVGALSPVFAGYDGDGDYSAAEAAALKRPALTGAWKGVNGAFGAPVLTAEDIEQAVKDALTGADIGDGALTAVEIAAIAAAVVTGLGALRFEPTTSTPSV